MDWVVDVAMVVGTFLLIAIGMTIYTRLNPTRPIVGPDHYIYTGIIPTITVSSEDSPVKLSPKVRTPADSDEEVEDGNKNNFEARKIEYPKNTRLSVPEPDEDDEEEETAQTEGLDKEVLKELKILEQINQPVKRKEKGTCKEESERKADNPEGEKPSKEREKKGHQRKDEDKGKINVKQDEKGVLERADTHFYIQDTFKEEGEQEGPNQGENSVVIEKEGLKRAEEASEEREKKPHEGKDECNKSVIVKEKDILERVETHSQRSGNEEYKHLDVVRNVEDKHKAFEEVNQDTESVCIKERGSEEDILKRLAEKHTFLREDPCSAKEDNDSEYKKFEYNQNGSEEEQLTLIDSASTSKEDKNILHDMLQQDRNSSIQEESKTQIDPSSSRALEEDTETEDDILRRLMEKHSFLIDLENEDEEVPSYEDVDLSREREVLKKALLGQVNMGFSFGSEGVPESCALMSDLLEDTLNQEKKIHEEPKDLQLFISQLNKHQNDEEDETFPELLVEGEDEQSDSLSLPEEDLYLEMPIPVFEENIVFIDDRYLDSDGFVQLPRVNICGSKIGTSHTVEEPLFPFNEILKEEELAQKAHVKKRLSH